MRQLSSPPHKVRRPTPSEHEAFARRYGEVIRPAIYARSMIRQEKTDASRGGRLTVIQQQD